MPDYDLLAGSRQAMTKLKRSLAAFAAAPFRAPDAQRLCQELMTLLAPPVQTPVRHLKWVCNRQQRCDAAAVNRDVLKLANWKRYPKKGRLTDHKKHGSPRLQHAPRSRGAALGEDLL